jgi:putative tryptophan/tyrosine transport system substrate-binding protein
VKQFWILDFGVSIEGSISRKVFPFISGLLLAASSYAAEPQGTKVPRVGFLSPSESPQNDFRYAAFQQGLRELGYVGAKNITFEYRGTDGKVDRYNEFAADLVRRNVDVIVTATQAGVLAAKNASARIPIVMAAAGDPVGGGLVASLARPGSNITGLSNIQGQLSGKRLELLKEVLPRAKRVAVLRHGASPLNSLNETKAAAGALGLELQLFEVADFNEFDAAFFTMKKKRADALVVLPSPMLVDHRTAIIDFTANQRVPAMYPNQEYAASGGLMSYAADISDLFRRAAVYVDKILKGTKPADLPVEQPTKFELVINLKTAKQIGLTIPPNVLARADRVIK